jgi:hypothetical protein
MLYADAFFFFFFLSWPFAAPALYAEYFFIDAVFWLMPLRRQRRLFRQLAAIAGADTWPFRRFSALFTALPLATLIIFHWLPPQPRHVAPFSSLSCLGLTGAVGLTG